MARLTESALRNMIRKELKEMMGSGNNLSNLSDKLYGYLKQADSKGLSSISVRQVAEHFGVTPEEIIKAYHHEPDEMDPLEDWAELQGDKFVFTGDL